MNESYMIVGDVVYLLNTTGSVDDIRSTLSENTLNEWTLRNVDRVVYGENMQECLKMSELTLGENKILGKEHETEESDPWA